MNFEDISLQWRNENEHIKNMSIPIPFEEFGLDHEERSLDSEYKVLTFMTQTQSHVSKLYQNPEQFQYNRNAHIMTFDSTRPILSTEEEKDKVENYINANIIDIKGKPAIATQGPLTSTFYNLYRMIQKYKITSMFMLCCLLEKNKIKCDRYWPNLETEGGKMTEKEYEVYLLSETKEQGLKTRKIRIKNTTNDFEIELDHYQITNWPDGDKPLASSKKTINSVLEVFLKKLELEEYPTVHCSAGVGRTGTFIAMALFKKILLTETEISVFDQVRVLREQRWGLVYTFTQYEYLYEYVEDILLKKNNKDKGNDESEEEEDEEKVAN